MSSVLIAISLPIRNVVIRHKPLDSQVVPKTLYNELI